MLWWYAVDDTGRFIYRKGVLQRLKGWGKDPHLAVISLERDGAGRAAAAEHPEGAESVGSGRGCTRPIAARRPGESRGDGGVRRAAGRSAWARPSASLALAHFSGITKPVFVPHPRRPHGPNLCEVHFSWRKHVRT